MSIDDIFLKRIKVIGDGEYTLLGAPIDLIDDIAELLRQARLEEIEGILGVDGGKDFVNQMANAVGVVGRRYKELTGVNDLANKDPEATT